MEFTMTVKMDNAAFADEPGLELALILQSVANKVKNGERSKNVFDSNGTRVGEFAITS